MFLIIFCFQINIYYNIYNIFSRIFNKDNVRIIDKGTRLKITGVTARDNGVYSCRAENVAGAVDSMTNYILNVQGISVHFLTDCFSFIEL